MYDRCIGKQMHWAKTDALGSCVQGVRVQGSQLGELTLSPLKASLAVQFKRFPLTDL